MRNTLSTGAMENICVHLPQKGDLRDSEGSTIVLQKAIKRAEGISFRNKPMQ